MSDNVMMQISLVHITVSYTHLDVYKRQLQCARKGTAMMRHFEPDTIIEIGGGSAMDAEKIMWVMYELSLIHISFA